MDRPVRVVDQEVLDMPDLTVIGSDVVALDSRVLRRWGSRVCPLARRNLLGHPGFARSRRRCLALAHFSTRT
jgi:hypothetical protein